MKSTKTYFGVCHYTFCCTYVYYHKTVHLLRFKGVSNCHGLTGDHNVINMNATTHSNGSIYYTFSLHMHFELARWRHDLHGVRT